MLEVDKGGRQGRTFGGKLFNFIYQDALVEVRSILLTKNICVVFSCCPEVPFWTQRAVDGCVASSSVSSDIPCVDVTFVDDEAYVVTAKNHATLDCHVQTVIRCLVDVLESKFAMELNFKPGKSECMIKYRR